MLQYIAINHYLQRPLKIKSIRQLKAGEMLDSRQCSVHTEHALGWILTYSLACLIFNVSLRWEQPQAGGGSEDQKALHRNRINILPIRSAL